MDEDAAWLYLCLGVYIYIYISWVTSFRELADLASLEDMFLLIAPLTRCGAEECEEEEE